jgi:acyl carrier protein
VSDTLKRKFTPEQVAGRAHTILVEQLGVEEDEVTPNARLVDDLGADSLDTVEVTMALEEEFNIEIPDADVERIVTVQDVVNYLTRRLTS